jgi:O-acetylhomoserine (thiol)-lyase
MRARAEGLRDFGACLSPTNAFHLIQGVETLPLRMARHIENAAAVVAFLGKHPAVEWVLHPSLPTHPDHALAQRLLPKGSGAIVSFGIKGGRPAGRKFIEAVRLASHLANVGDAKTLVIHPASTTHAQMDAGAHSAAGVSEGRARRPEGLSHAPDRSGRRDFRRHRRPPFRSGAAGDGFFARRRPRSFGLGAPCPRLRLSRLRRARARSSRARPLGWRAA